MLVLVPLFIFLMSLSPTSTLGSALFPSLLIVFTVSVSIWVASFVLSFLVLSFLLLVLVLVLLALLALVLVNLVSASIFGEFLSFLVQLFVGLLLLLVPLVYGESPPVWMDLERLDAMVKMS